MTVSSDCNEQTLSTIWKQTCFLLQSRDIYFLWFLIKVMNVTKPLCTFLYKSENIPYIIFFQLI